MHLFSSSHRNEAPVNHTCRKLFPAGLVFCWLVCLFLQLLNLHKPHWCEQVQKLSTPEHWSAHKTQPALLWLKSRCPLAASHRLIDTSDAFGSQNDLASKTHLANAPHFCPPAAHGGNSSGWRALEMVFVQHVKQASSIASLRHKFQSCLFRNDYRLVLPRKPSSLKHTSSNYLLRYFLAPLKLGILFSFIRLRTVWLYTELDYDPWFILPPILFISLNCLEIARLLHGN